MTIYLREEDGWLEGSDEHFMFHIDALGPHMPGLVKGEKEYSANDGKYKIFYNLIHGFDKK